MKMGNFYCLFVLSFLAMVMAPAYTFSVSSTLLTYLFFLIYITSSVVFAGNTVSALVFWPTSTDPLTPTSFLLICLALIDNVMLFLYYLLLGVPFICTFSNTCQYYVKVNVRQ